jgi:hypothetical protein
MTNKILRKQLELTLVKTIDDILTKVNAVAAKKIKKSAQEASKTIAKKFFKTIKSEEKTKKKPSGIVVKKTVVIPKRIVKTALKKASQK